MKPGSFFALVFLLILSGCHGLSVQEHDLAAFPAMPADARPSPIGFDRLRYHIPTGSEIAATSPKGVLGLFQCGMPYVALQRGMVKRTIIDDNIKQIFNDTLEAQGYDVTGSPGRMFDEEADIQRTVYAIGARVTSMKIDMCKQNTVLGTLYEGYSGEGEVTIDWTVFDLLHRRNVLQATTSGYAEQTTPNYEGMQLIFEEAFSAAAHNLGAMDDFRDLVVYGRAPETPPKTIQDLNEDPAGMFDPQEKVTLQPLRLSTTPATGRWENIMKTAVMVEAGGDHGSGFFVTRDGHIITNAHVVGNALQVRVVTSGKKEKLIGEVLRVDRLRDVALIRLEQPLDNIPLLPLRTGKVSVGEDVYAIGAPRARQMQDTVTRGIVSAHRYNRKEQQPYIQADVDVYEGNSGGPLIDANGNIVGIGVSGYAVDNSAETLGGLNNFIPIDDALKELDIAAP